MADAVPNANAGAFKRRSTRIVQAVPLTVTGVDALGRPFEERTSTSILNCHGCRYQSKHYVLKNMWVTLEVPHPEQGRPPRNVRARVMWIQRPRTVRELFQVGVELEVAGNLWGIAFCPPDWFPFPDSESEIQVPRPEAPHEEALPEPAEAVPEAAEEWSGSREQVPAEDNIRTMPMPGPIDGGAELSLTLTQQMERLVNEAQQQLRAAVRDRAAEAVAAEAQPLLASLQTQLQETAERSAQLAAAAAVEQAIRSAAGNAEAAAEARLRELVDRFNDQLSRSLEQYQQKLEIRSGEIGTERREAFEQQFQSQVEQRLNDLATASADSQKTLERTRENLEALRRQAEDSISAALRDGALRLQTQADDARTRVSEIETVLRHSMEQIAPVSISAQAEWKAQLEAETAAATKRWDDQVEGSIEGAAQKVAERLTGTAQAASERFEKDLDERIAGISKTFMEVSADAQGRLATARASLEDQVAHVQALLTQVQSATQPIADQTAQLDALRSTAQEELERRVAALLDSQTQELARRAAAMVDSQTQELARRADGVMAGLTQHLQPSLDAVQQEFERRVSALVDSQTQELARRADSVMAGLTQHLQPSLDAVQQELERRVSALVDSQSQELARRAEGVTVNWNERLQPSLDTVQQELERRVSALIDNQSQELTRRAESVMAGLAQHLQPALDAAQQELERRATALAEIQGQESARQAESAMATWTARMQPSLETAQQELERRAAALVEIQSQELARRGANAIATWTERLQPSLEAAAQETVARLGRAVRTPSRFAHRSRQPGDRAHRVRITGRRRSAPQTRRGADHDLKPDRRSGHCAIAKADGNSGTRLSRSWPPHRCAVAGRD